METEPFSNLERHWDSENVGVIREARWPGKTAVPLTAVGRPSADSLLLLKRDRCPPEPLLFGV